MPVIVCHINLFDAVQPIAKVGSGGEFEVIEYAATNDLIEQIPAACYSADTTEVRIFGPTDYCNMLAQQIAENDNSKYSNMSLNIEVNP